MGNPVSRMIFIIIAHKICISVLYFNLYLIQSLTHIKVRSLANITAYSNIFMCIVQCVVTLAKVFRTKNVNDQIPGIFATLFYP